MRSILEKINRELVIFDGAMGTELYNKGFFLNLCYDEICLTRPDIIKQIHLDYISSGADVIETNSFGANVKRLSEYGLKNSCFDINKRAAEIACEAVKSQSRDILVAGSVGPTLLLNEDINKISKEELKKNYRIQIEGLKVGGADFIIFETFYFYDEMVVACEVAKEFGFETVASFTILGENSFLNEKALEKIFQDLDNCKYVDIIGLNCGSGCVSIYNGVKNLIKKIKKPLVVMPNAGLPKDIDGRMIYLTTPEYFTEYAKRFVALGVRAVGGCCGTTYQHIKDISKALKSFVSEKKRVEIKKVNFNEDKPVLDLSNFAKKIVAKSKISSVEIVTPAGSSNLDSMLEKSEICKNSGVDVINIPDGPRASSRISPMVAAIKIEQNIGMETVLHYCCRDRNSIGMQADLLGASAMGLKNILLITGDPPKLGAYPDATAVFDIDSVGLTSLVKNLNYGYDLIGSKITPPTNFFMGVGANPYALDIDKEFQHLVNKIDAGADFIITQPVFDVKTLLQFIERLEKSGKSIPVIAGVWPLISYKNALFMKNEVPGVVVPDEIVGRMEYATTKESGIALGTEIAQKICKEIYSSVAGFQVSAPFGNVKTAINVLDF